MTEIFVDLGDDRSVRPSRVEAITIENCNFKQRGHNHLATLFWFEVRVYLAGGSYLRWNFPYGEGESMSRKKSNSKREEVALKKSQKFKKGLLAKLGKSNG